MEKQFIDGLFINPPREGAPDFVKANISMKRLELIEWLKKQEGERVNAGVLVSKKDPSKWYAEVDTWKPKEGEGRVNGATEASVEDLPW